MNPVVHFELPAENRKRMSDFYTKAFGWKTQQMGPDMGDYVLVTTAEVDENRMPKKPGQINGGFYQKTDDSPMQFPSIVISVDNIRESMKKVENSGGNVSGEPVEIPGVGWYVTFLDTEGNRISMLQPLPR